MNKLFTLASFLLFAKGEEDSHEGHHEWWALYHFEEAGTYQIAIAKDGTHYDADHYVVLAMEMNGLDWHDIDENAESFEEAAEANSAVEIGFGDDLTAGTVVNATWTDAVQ